MKQDVKQEWGESGLWLDWDAWRGYEFWSMQLEAEMEPLEMEGDGLARLDRYFRAEQRGFDVQPF